MTEETPPSSAADSGRRLLVMMPALNEAATIAGVIARIPRDIEGLDRVEVLVVDDGSTDETVKLAREAGASVISHGVNRGVGHALQTGIDEAIARRVDFVVNIDSDGQFSPEDIPTLLAPLLREEADFATASRFKDPELVPDMPWVKKVGNWGMARIISRICRQDFRDVSCGFRAYTRETILRLVLTGAFTYTQEMFLALSQKGLRIAEVPIRVRGVREVGESRIASNLFKYAYRTLSIIFGSIRDYSPGAFFNRAAFMLVMLSMMFGAFFFGHYAITGHFTPHVWSGFVSAFLFVFGAMVFALGQVALMVSWTRELQDRQLYLLRKYLSALGDDRDVLGPTDDERHP